RNRRAAADASARAPDTPEENRRTARDRYLSPANSRRVHGCLAALPNRQCHRNAADRRDRRDLARRDVRRVDVCDLEMKNIGRLEWPQVAVGGYGNGRRVGIFECVRAARDERFASVGLKSEETNVELLGNAR